MIQKLNPIAFAICVCIVSMALSSCMTSPQKPGLRKTITLDKSLETANSRVAAVWLSYAGHISADMNGFYANNEKTVPYIASIEAETDARQSMASMWLRIKKDYPNDTDPYLDDLVKVVEKGFLSEYLYAYYRKDNWPDAPTLKNQDFASWYATTIPDHRPVTLASVELATND